MAENQERIMYGIPDLTVALAYAVVFLSTLLCVGYGLFQWNKEEILDEEEIIEDRTASAGEER